MGLLEGTGPGAMTQSYICSTALYVSQNPRDSTWKRIFAKTLEFSWENCEIFTLWQNKDCTFSIKIENKNKDTNSQSPEPPF